MTIWEYILLFVCIFVWRMIPQKPRRSKNFVENFKSEVENVEIQSYS